MLPGNKRKPLLNKEDEYEVAPVSPQQRRNSQFNESDIDFEENEADDDSLIINVASIGNKGMALSGSRKPAKISSKQVYLLVQLLDSYFFFLSLCTSSVYMCTISS